MALLAGLAVLLFSVPSIRAQAIPPGCAGSAIGISLFTSSPDVHIGDTLLYSVSVFNGVAGSPISCDASNIVASITTPDGIVHPVVLRRTYLSHTQSDFYTNVVSYVARAQDIRPDGTLRATAEDTAVIFQNDTPSNGGANQGVNTEVSQPCIQLLVQCVPSTGQNGAITFTGAVTNCGNNTLVGVTVTNYVNGGAVAVLFPTNLLRGQSVVFSGSYVPANPCLPSTSTLVAVGVDQFTSNPRTVTSTNATTCSAVFTPGIKVTKTCPVGPTAPGQLLTFSGSVSNSGNVTLTNIVVVNDQPTPNTPVFTRASLAPGAVATFTGSYRAPTDCAVTDTLTVNAATECGVPVASTVSATCPILTSPQIAVTADCSGNPVAPGGLLTYGGTVTNTGNITLTNVVVISDRPAPNTTVFTVARLAPGAGTNYTSSYTVPLNFPLNACSVTVNLSGSGRDICNGAAVTNSTSAVCSVTTTPRIAVVLNCPLVPAAAGGTITYSGTVSNSGNVTLNNVVVVSGQASPGTVLTVPSLAPGATANFTAGFIAPVNVCAVSSTVTARGSDACSASMVTNTASATCPLISNPRLVVTQSCPVNPVTPGDTLIYSGSVSNAGNITLTNIVVLNDRSGATPVFASALLLPGATTNFTGRYTVPDDSTCSVTADLTVTGRDICTGNTVRDTISATCAVGGTPLIAVTLNCPVVPVATGGASVFSGTVSNSGNVTLNNVVVVNSQATPSTVLTVPSLAPRASASFTASFTSTANSCFVTGTVTVRGSNACTAGLITNTASATCPLVTTPRIIVMQNCPTNPASPGGVVNYSGSVSNAGNITLTNIVVVNNQSASGINPSGGPATFGTLAPLAGTITDRFGAGTNFSGMTFANQDKGYGANQFYSLRREASGSSTFVTVNANGMVTGRFDAGNRNFDALTFAAPDVGYGPVIFYYLSHDNAGESSFGTIKPGGVVGVVADLFVVGNNFDALTFAATDVGYGANLFYYLRHDNNGRSTFGTINPALPGTATDRFIVGTNFDALVFTATDVGYGANLFYYLRHDTNGRSIFGTISGSGTVTDRFNADTNLNDLVFTATDVGLGANLFYYLRGGGNATGTNTNAQPVFTLASLAPGASANFTGSYSVPGGSVCSVAAVVTATGRDICSGNTVTNTTTATCPLTTAPLIAVTLNCPVVPAVPGGLVTYTGTVSNRGNVTLNNVVVVNSQAAPSTVLTVASLAPGASANFTASITSPANACSVTSTVSARGSDACTASMVTNTASATCLLSSNPRLIVTQNCPANPVSPGGLLTYSGSVSNAGNITLTNVVITNDRSGTTPVFTVVSLAPRASSNFTGSFTVPPGACFVTAIITATGRDTCAGLVVTDTNTATCPVTGTPRIFVTQDCPTTPVRPGGLLTYSGMVSNSGNVTLTNVVVRNNRSGTAPIFTTASLAPGAKANFTGSYVTHPDCCVDSSTVTATGGTPCSGLTVSDTDTATCPMLTLPRIVVTKVCPTKDAKKGEVVRYSGTVSNAGDITLINVTVANPRSGTNSPLLGPITLVPGESASYTASYKPSADSCGDDTVTARGLDFCTQAIVVHSVTETCPVPPANPALRVTKKCPLQPAVRGGAYVFTGTVMNIGDVTLINVFVVNNQPSNNTPVIGPITLAPGASTNFSGSAIAPLDCCETTDTLTARGQDRCSGMLVSATASQVCPLLTTPRIVVAMECPTVPVPVGGLYIFTGSVTNTGDIVLTNVMVFSSQPSANTLVMGPIELAPGESEGFSGSYTVGIGASGPIVTASGLDTCQARRANASANCSGPIVEPSQPRAITVVINGNGVVNGVTNHQILTIGQSYTVTATPAAGSTFVNWAGGVSGASTTLTYIMRSNLVLIANFAVIGTNPPGQLRAISVVINGNGSVSGVTNGQLLNLGQSYTATAIPSAGSIFVNWSGGVSASSTSLNYVMRSNLVLIANFVVINTNGSNAFTPVAGTFKGLFLESDEVQNASSGYFTFILTDKGNYTGSLLTEGKKYSFSGRLSPEGRATNTITRTSTSVLTVVWDLQSEGDDIISGMVTDGEWSAELMGDRAVFNKRTNPAPQAGRYTLIIPGTPGSVDSPEGDGYGTVIVDGSGMLSFAGTLADGTKVTQKGCISKNGEWPLYVSLYSGRGSLLGWLRFANRTGDDLSGRLSWINPTNSRAKFYPAVFGVDSDALGSRYVAPVGTGKVLEITDGVIVLSGGNLAGSSTNEVTLGERSKVTSAGPNAVTLNFTLSSGLFKGTHREDGTTRKTTFGGAVLQKANHGSGYFHGTNQSGRVVFRAAP